MDGRYTVKQLKKFQPIDNENYEIYYKRLAALSHMIKNQIRCYNYIIKDKEILIFGALAK